MARYDRLADAYDAFQRLHSPYYEVADDTLRRLLGRGAGRCIDIGCGGGRFLPTLLELGWSATGVDASEDQLRVARERAPRAEFVLADATAFPFPDETFDAGVSLFTHTDFDDFAVAVAEARRVLKPRGRFVYIGNHPCFVGVSQEHNETGLPRLHPGYRRTGRWDADDAPGATPSGWRVQLGSFVHLPLEPFLNSFAGFTLDRTEEPDNDREYPATFAVALTKP